MLDFIVEENFHMQENVKEHRNPFLRKIIAVVFLPIIIFVWMTGWTLTQIGSQREQTETSQKTPQTHLQYEKESEAPDEDLRITNEPQIVA